MMNRDVALAYDMFDNYREAMLKLRENLIASAEERLNGKLGFSIYEVTAKMNEAIREVVNGRN
jgi:hypothetical protein